MRKGLVGFMVLVVLVGLSSSIYAGGIINKQNLSADYIRTLNRNAATDMADAAAFNPAGTAMMQDGLYVKADAIYLWKDYTNQMPSTPAIFNLGTLESGEPSIIPEPAAALSAKPIGSLKYRATFSFTSGPVEMSHMTRKNAIMAVTKSA